MMTPLTSATVLVTGATGFIGSRLVERLVVQHGARVRALVRSFTRAARIARFPVDLVHGDIRSAEAVARAAAGCQYVFHCAYGSDGDDADRRVVNAQGSANVFEAALRARCSRVVHVSSVTVYGDTPDGPLDETAPRRKTGFAYADSKIDAEATAFQYAGRGLSVAVVQPTVVYGPFGTTWTIKPLQLLKTGRVVLIDNGAGLANLVYIDDVVSAMLVAAVHEAAHGQAFLISGDGPTTWKAFYAAYEEMIGHPSTISMTAGEARRLYDGEGAGREHLVTQAWRLLGRPVVRARIAATREGQMALRLWRRLPPAIQARVRSSHHAPVPAVMASSDPRPVHPLHPSKIRFMQSRTEVHVDKARRLLGVTPEIGFPQGMAATRAWAEWARLL